ncbi:hypothetical protein [Streptomyces taklimakanensis]|uniref:hypothetical protein n=1 Tax=Streptomyces taklimakanensis TaxID=2569853 RepID=UPI003B75D32E
MCDRVMVVDHGRPVYDGALAGLHRTGDGERTLVVDPSVREPEIEDVIARMYARDTVGAPAPAPVPAGPAPAGPDASQDGR